MLTLFRLKQETVHLLMFTEGSPELYGQQGAELHHFNQILQEV